MNAPDISAATAARRKQFYEEIRALDMTPLWESLHALVPPSPAPGYVPKLWRYRDISPFLAQSGQLISAQEAVRRVLILENPGLIGSSSVTQSLYAGLQLILPGEVAPSHRHAQSALRFVLEGRGAYTTVNGERTTMHRGDFIITPSWRWHDHGNQGFEGGSEPVVWLDGLDIPMLRFFGAGFAENAPTHAQQVDTAEGLSYTRYGHNMAPVRNTGPLAHAPLFNYPYARSREALESLKTSEACDAWLGHKLRYVNPSDGGSPMATMATFLQLLPAGFHGKPHRSTDGTVYCVAEGEGMAMIDAQTFAFERNDIFVVPSWSKLSLTSERDAVLFSYSDRPMQLAAGILREAFLDN